jgi:hypothetical protein
MVEATARCSEERIRAELLASLELLRQRAAMTESSLSVLAPQKPVKKPTARAKAAPRKRASGRAGTKPNPEGSSRAGQGSGPPGRRGAAY